MTTLADAPATTVHDVPSPRPPSRSRRLLRGPESDPAWARPALLGLLAGDRRALPLGPRRVRLGQLASTRPRCRPARRAGRRSSSARSDAANSITVDKPPASLWVMALSARLFGLNSWSILVPAGADGRRRGRRALRDGAALVRPGRRPARRRGAGADAGRRADVPVQQPRRAARAAAGRGGVRHGPGARGRPAPGGWCSAGALVGFGFLTKMLQAFLVRARRSRWSTWSPRRRRCGGGSCQLLVAGVRADRRRPAGGSRSSSWCPASSRPVHRRLAEQQHPRADLRLQRLRPAHRQRDRQRRRRRRQAGGSGARPGWTRMFNAEFGGQIVVAAAGRADPARRRARGDRGARRAPTGRAPRCSSGAAGCSSPALVVQPHGRASSTRTTRSPWRPAIGALVGIGAVRAVAAPARRRRRGAVLAAAVAVTAAWAFVLLRRSRRLVPVAARRWCSSSAWPRRSRCSSSTALPAARWSPRVAGVGAARRAGRPRGVRAADRGHRRTPASIPTAGPGGRPAASADPAAARAVGGPRRGFGAAPRRRPATARPAPPAAAPAARRGGRRAWAACSTAARPSAALVGAARGGRRRRTPGSPRRSAPTTRPATSSPPALPVMADRRLQRHRPVADAGAVPGATCAAGQDPLLHRRRRLRRRRQSGGSRRLVVGDRDLGGAELHRPDRRRRHRLRPHRRPRRRRASSTT